MTFNAVIIGSINSIVKTVVSLAMLFTQKLLRAVLEFCAVFAD